MGARKRMHTTFEDGEELVGEYDARTSALLERKWKANTMMGGNWEHEIGSPLRPAESTKASIGLILNAQNVRVLFGFHRPR